MAAFLMLYLCWVLYRNLPNPFDPKGYHVKE